MAYRVLFGLMIVCVLLPWRAAAESRAEADAPDGERCIAYHKEGQVLRGQGSLLAAGKKLQSCLHPACSPVLREACALLVEEVERDTPSVVFGAVSAGADLTDVRVLDGGVLLLSRLTGRALSLDPGVHQLRFEADGQQPLDRTIVLRVGEKNRAVNVTMEALARPTEVKATSSVRLGVVPPVPPRVIPDPTARASPSTGLSFADYAPFGLGVLLGAGGLVVALDARSDLEAAKRTCSPHCSEDRQDRILAKSLVADGLFLLTGVAFTYGTIRILLRSPHPPAAAAVVVQPGYIGGRVQF